MSYLFLFLAAFAIAFFLVPLIRHFVIKAKMLDVPTLRSSHSLPTPRGGGLAIVFSFFAVFIIFYFRQHFSTDLLFAFLGSGLIVAAVGFADDRLKVSARYRIFVHLFAAVWALFFLGGFLQYDLFSLAGLIKGIFWLVSVVWVVNMYNFMDGIDSLAASESVFVGFASAVMLYVGGDYILAMIVMLLAMSSLGFLFWNLPPAKIFMGDVGSGFLGICIGVLALASIMKGTISVWVWVILLGSFLSDSIITLGRRILRGEKCYIAHRSHAYQHAAHKLGSHGKISAWISAINLFWLFPCAFAANYWNSLAILLVFIAYIPLIYIIFKFDAGLEKDLYRHEVEGLNSVLERGSNARE